MLSMASPSSRRASLITASNASRVSCLKLLLGCLPKCVQAEPIMKVSMRRSFAWCSGGRPGGRRDDRASVARDDDFAEMFALGHVFESLLAILKRKHTVHYWPNLERRDRARHRLEIFDGSYCHALYALLLHNNERNSARCLRRACKHADERNSSTNSRGPNRFIQCADAADLDHEIDALAEGHLAHSFSPFRHRAVIDCLVSPQALQFFDLRLARRGRDDTCAAHFCELEREQGYAAGPLSQDDIARLRGTRANDCAPRCQRSAGQGGCFRKRHMGRRMNQRFL